MEAVDSSLVIKNDTNNFKEKVREWYLNNIANNRNSINKVLDLKVKAENTAGGIAVSFFAPYLLPIVPAVQKGYKALREAERKAIKKFMHKKLDINESNIKENEMPEILKEIDDEKIEKLVNTGADIIAEKKGLTRK